MVRNLYEEQFSGSQDMTQVEPADAVLMQPEWKVIASHYLNHGPFSRQRMKCQGHWEIGQWQFLINHWTALCWVFRFYTASEFEVGDLN